MSSFKRGKRICSLILSIALMLSACGWDQMFQIKEVQAEVMEDQTVVSSESIASPEIVVSATPSATSIASIGSVTVSPTTPGFTESAETTTAASIEPVVTLAPSIEPTATVEPSGTIPPVITEEPPVTEEPVIETLLPPAKVKKLFFCARGKKKVQLTWKKSIRATGYRIFRKTIGGSGYKKMAVVSGTKWTDTKVSFGKSYKYKIVAINELNGEIDVSKACIKTFRNVRYVSTNHQKYSYTEMSADIKGLAKKYHGIMDYQVIGKSEDDRKIYDVIVGNPKAKKTLLVVSNLHAREYMTSLLCMNQIEYYLENYYGRISGKKAKSVLNKVAIHFIPMANPDGTTISQYGINHIRKASLRKLLYRLNKHGTTRWKANARGVDLNRNYPAYFRIQEHRSSEGYSGPYAASESETRAIIQLTKDLKKNHHLQGVVNYHAMGSIVFGGCSLGGALRTNTRRMYYTARSITHYADSAGYKSGSKGHGNYREYMVYILKVPSITLEVGRVTCPGPIWEYPSIWSRNASVVFREAALFT